MYQKISLNSQKLVLGSDTILTAIKKIEEIGHQIVIVRNNDGQAVGWVSDGDVRRAIIDGVSLEAQVETILSKKFVFAFVDQTLEEIATLMNINDVARIPVLDEFKRPVFLIVKDSDKSKLKNSVPVCLMAGGLGTRLKPLTNNYPKPMLEIGGKPILEHIISQLRDQGFWKFYISVNYKGDVIKDFFENGSKLGVEISYITENKRLGTAGSLSLLDIADVNRLVVMNGDILTKTNVNDLLQQHEASNATATMCCRNHGFEIPFGVVRVDGRKIIDIDEKPEEQFLINAGIYVLNRDAVEQIPFNKFYDMPNLFRKLIKKNFPVSYYISNENWIDVGRHVDLERARENMNDSLLVDGDLK
ncbi:nucleotidyltransferase family protein [bacterium]|nr:nucleotidyltransferase family protein [bacterium]